MITDEDIYEALRAGYGDNFTYYDLIEITAMLLNAVQDNVTPERFKQIQNEVTEIVIRAVRNE